MARWRRAAFATCLLWPLAACDNPVAISQADLSAVADHPTLIQPGEKVRVTVFGEANVSGDFDVDPQGYIVVPLAGRVKAQGMTEAGLETEVRRKLSGTYLRDPKVTVDVVQRRPFYITGEVERAGEVPYRAGMNVITALAVSGGATYRASQNRVLIKRADAVDFKEYPQSSLVPVYPGDVIRVPERYF